MKKSILVLFTLFTSYFGFTQDNNGFIVEYNKLIPIEYQVYTPPLRINKVEKQSDIDYSKIEGLLQSYLSADNIDWAKSEYISTPKEINRNEEHFDAVKKANLDDYIQLETAYIFDYQNRKFAFVKYSLIFKELPFPWTSLMVLENKNNHWYISELINQNQILLLLGNMSNDFILDCLNQEMKDTDLKKIIDKARIGNTISIGKLSLEIDSLGERLKNKFYDKRIIDESVDFRNALLNSPLKSYHYEVYHPFLIKLFQIYEYEPNTVVDKNMNTFKGEVESILLSDEPINLLSKIYIDYGDEQYYLIKYKKNNKVMVDIIKNDKGQFKIVNNNSLRDLALILSEYKTSFIQNLIENPKKEYAGSSGGTNINEMIEYIKNRK